ncbi:hypothetical protein KSD_89970 [Ktedonobacter sp. SOSP1-85]|uniref:hypothetical protein n=1 Tax=Ktedonobacter sp. SOSP1-85 TaxID=2778367 RepID=UPI0019153812|nr:hypothetical protein [Ktedonobacter sp. SOSP1-85]GHO81226.1 hypothetical protein KSD_89970 [Ktedonobacter sp. SOSP1-85]
MKQLASFLGAFSYEFRMQIRRPALWITMTIIVFLILASTGRSTFLVSYAQHVNKQSSTSTLVVWMDFLSILLPIGIGLMMADRLYRDRKTQVEELFTSLPNALSSRLLGKYLGGLGAASLPLFTIYMLGVLYILFQTGDWLVLPQAVAVFALVSLPGLLFISAFSLACPRVMWVPLYQFLFVGYWFWGNLLHNPQIPSLSYTLLTPIGDNLSRAFFPGRDQLFISSNPTPLVNGFISLGLLVGLAALVLIVLVALMKWQQAQQ